MMNELLMNPLQGGEEKETWNLTLRHYAFRPATYDSTRPGVRDIRRVGIILEAVRKGDGFKLGDNVMIGTASFRPGKKPEVMMFTTYPKADRFVDELIAQGYAKYIGKNIERMPEGSGLRTMREYHYHHLDLTAFYDSYIEQHLKAMNDSPLSHFRIHEGQDEHNIHQQDRISCRMGGLEMPKVEVGVEGRRFSEAASLYPECRFHLYELATDSFATQLNLYREVQQRMTDFSVLFRNGSHYVRCRIDGEQQMAKEINLLDICDYERDKDQAALVAKYFARELQIGEKLSQGRGR